MLLRSSVEAAPFRLGMLIEETLLELGSFVSVIIMESQRSGSQMLTLNYVINERGSNMGMAPR